MPSRQDIIEIFSTFLQFEADRFSGWVTDAQLRRSMQRSLAQLPQPEISENFWALYWYKVWQSQPRSQARDACATLARPHLTAYLQEACYWAAQKTATSFASTQYTISDCCQLAITHIDKVLNGFNPQQGLALKNYAAAIFSSAIREILRQRREVDICTPWALLRKISQKRLVESLQTSGLSEEAIAGYVLAWKCFNRLYVPTLATGTRKLDSPTRATWEAIASLYNKERYQQPRPPGAECNPETLEKWLLNCAKATRAYLYPTLTSINITRLGQESGELLDNLPGGEEESLLTQIITEEEESERNTQQSQINAVLVAAMQEMEPQAQQLLQMYYGQGLTQQQMAQQLDIQQYTVSRRLTNARKSLLLTLARWSGDTLHISLTSDVLKNTSTVLEEWLKVHYSHPQ